MKCPRDGHELKTEKFHGVTVDHCSKCHGVWFAKDELKRAKDNTDEDLRWLDADLFEEKGGKFHKKSGTRKCPEDGTAMHTKTYAHSSVSVDVCEKCDGVWLDGQEFDKIIDYLHKQIYSETAKEYSEDLLKELVSGKEGEIKDLAILVRLFEERLAAEHEWIADLSKFLFVNLPFK